MVQPSLYFDFWGILQNEIFGSVMLFILGILILVLIVTLRNRMPFQLSIGFAVLWLLIASQGTGIFWILMVFAIATFFGIMVTRYYRRS